MYTISCKVWKAAIAQVSREGELNVISYTTLFEGREGLHYMPMDSGISPLKVTARAMVDPLNVYLFCAMVRLCKWK